MPAAVFWDKKYGAWRAAGDDPGSALYVESRDVDPVIGYIATHYSACLDHWHVEADSANPAGDVSLSAAVLGVLEDLRGPAVLD